ncbi:hypothetical protein P692DRAFT_20881010 [Suillus brevipes Sb2]|jgi:hypothetical protein|nr:hypothetical protein P692DRAFT_20881010 [Suillus brevipes Sb2]
MTWKVLSDVLVNCKGVTRLTNDDDASDKIVAVAKSAGDVGLRFFLNLWSYKLDLLQPAQRKKVSMRNNSEARTALTCLSEVVDTLIPKGTNGGALARANGNTNVIVEHEMQSAAAAIEAATQRLQELMSRLRDSARLMLIGKAHQSCHRVSARNRRTRQGLKLVNA